MKMNLYRFDMGKKCMRKIIIISQKWKINFFLLEMRIDGLGSGIIANCLPEGPFSVGAVF